MNSVFHQTLISALVATAAAIYFPPSAEAQTNNLKCSHPTSSDPGMPKNGQWKFLSACAQDKAFGFGRWDGEGVVSGVISRRFGKVSEGRFYGFILDVQLISPLPATTTVKLFARTADALS